MAKHEAQRVAQVRKVVGAAVLAGGMLFGRTSRHRLCHGSSRGGTRWSCGPARVWQRHSRHRAVFESATDDQLARVRPGALRLLASDQLVHVRHARPSLEHLVA